MGFTNAPGQKPSNGIETTEACCWTHVDIFEGSSLFFVYSFAYQVGVQWNLDLRKSDLKKKDCSYN